MNRSQILSNTRVEARRKDSGYRTEITMRQWIKMFLDELSITHSRHLMEWQVDYFISTLKRDERYSASEILQAKSALRFLFERVVNTEGDAENSDHTEDLFRITA